MSGETVTPLSPRRREALQAVKDGQVMYVSRFMSRPPQWIPPHGTCLGVHRPSLTWALKNRLIVLVQTRPSMYHPKAVRLTPAGENALEEK